MSYLTRLLSVVNPLQDYSLLEALVLPITFTDTEMLCEVVEVNPDSQYTAGQHIILNLEEVMAHG